MKAYQIGGQKGLESLIQTEVETPRPGPGEVLVKMRAVCLNHRDLLILSGKYGPARPETRIPVSDGVGEIAQLGEGVTGHAEGDRVSMPHFVNWIDGPFSPTVFGHDIGVTHDGWLAEYRHCAAKGWLPFRSALTKSTSACSPLTWTASTSW